MTPPSRRQLLGALGVAVSSAAGCAAGPSTDDPAANATDTTDAGPSTDDGPVLEPGETYKTDDGRSIRIGEPTVHPSVVTVEYVSSTHFYERVADAGDGQFLEFDVAVEGFDLATEKRALPHRPIEIPIAVEIDGERYADPIPVGRDRRASRDRVAVRVPVAAATDAAIRWERDDGSPPRWRLEASTVDRLAVSPEFEVRSWSVPDEVEYGERFDVSVTVENVGDRDGRFLSTLGARQGSLGVPETSVDVAVGETRTRTVTLDPHYSKGMESLRIVMEWDVDRRETTVAVRRSGA